MTAGSTIALASQNPGPKGDQGAPGATGPTGATPTLAWQPSDNGFIAAPCDPALAASNFTAVAGALYLVRARMAVTSVITSVFAAVRTPSAAGLANTYVGVYTLSGGTATLLGQTADSSTPFQNGGDVKVNLTTPTGSQPAGTVLLIGFLFGSATTVPTFRSVSGGDPNANLTAASPYRWSTIGTGQTALPATVTLASTASSGSLPWLGLA